jgi:two-component system chemotaxis response regulator CheB
VPGRDIVVIGGSAGGITALRDVVAELPRTLEATLFVVVHSSAESPGMLPDLLSSVGALETTYAEHGERFERGRIYVAPPDRHLLLRDGVMHVSRGPRENGFRPAVDPLFRTAATEHGSRVVGIVLSGGLDDGTHGLRDIKRHGGVAVAQHVEEATIPNMPLSAIQNVEVDYIVRAAEMGPLITRLASERLPMNRRRGKGRKAPAPSSPSSSCRPADAACGVARHRCERSR